MSRSNPDVQRGEGAINSVDRPAVRDGRSDRILAKDCILLASNYDQDKRELKQLKKYFFVFLINRFT